MSKEKTFETIIKNINGYYFETDADGDVYGDVDLYDDNGGLIGEYDTDKHIVKNAELSLNDIQNLATLIPMLHEHLPDE